MKKSLVEIEFVRLFSHIFAVISLYLCTGLLDGVLVE